MIKGLKFEIAGEVRQSSTKNTGLMTISKELVYMAKKKPTKYDKLERSNLH